MLLSIGLGASIQFATAVGGGVSPITVDLQTSRVSGVAPLYVQFDAIGTTHDTLTRPFHELDYWWDFGDPYGYYTGGNKGPVSAHVFDQPGSYTVTLYVRDLAGNITTQQVEITVDDPDVVFAGTNTICVSGTGDFTGAPSGCQQITSSVATSVLTGTSWFNKRVLFHLGETFTCSANIKAYNTGETIIGTYGTPGTVDARGIDSAAPVFSILHDSNVFTLGDHNTTTVCNDLRICGIRTSYDNGGTSGHLISADYRATRFLHYRCTDTAAKPHNYVWNVSYSIPDLHGTAMHAEFGMAQCYWNSVRGYCVFASGPRFSLINSRLRNSQAAGSHVVRMQSTVRHVMTGCDLGRSITSTQSYTLRGRDAATYPDPVDTQYVVLTDNVTSGSTAWIWHFGSQSTGHDETIRDVIVDGCSWDFENVGYLTPAAIHNAAVDVTIKNCWIGAIAAGITQVQFVTTSPYGLNPPTPVGATIANNTFATGATLSVAAILADASSGCEVAVKNNILYAPNATARTLTSGAGTFDTSNNLVDTNPLFVTAYTDLHLTASSPAIGYGTTVNECLRDHDDELRGATVDAGAYEYV